MPAPHGVREDDDDRHRTGRDRGAREPERCLPDLFTVEPGATDAELTEAEPALPDDVRTLLRGVTAVRTGGDGHLHLDPRLARVERRWMRGPGEGTRGIPSFVAGDHSFVDVHPGTGAWGAVFSRAADSFAVREGGGLRYPLVDLRAPEPPPPMEPGPTGGKSEESVGLGPQRRFTVAVPDGVRGARPRRERAVP
ncbi:hypothetical protein GCM10010266_32000 [Streptomyces griseomycini]|uniref:hypothetical protein n=1 Tax=Streptomyces griseomycini TaxID=66895 RepID=UPI001875B946|nr:hypothetical protein [Streptomyces griseomycini]GGQ06151.1 hypothetical protein GCM10010266_32000 [Streptomyces griseomycini]